MTAHTARRLAPDRVAGIARWMLVGILVVVLLIVLWPSRPAGTEQSTLQHWFAGLHARGFPSWIGFGLVEFGANVLMFLPLGVLGVAARPPFGAAGVIGCCAALSAAVELGQLLFIPGRTGDYRDLLANTLGAVLGALIARRWIARMQIHAEVEHEGRAQSQAQGRT